MNQDNRKILTDNIGVSNKAIQLSVRNATHAATLGATLRRLRLLAEEKNTYQDEAIYLIDGAIELNEKALMLNHEFSC